jgi:hypothetical protein
LGSLGMMIDVLQNAEREYAVFSGVGEVKY